MKLVNKVSSLEVKRCFAVANLCARTYKKRLKQTETAEEYKQRVLTVQKKVLHMKESAIDKIIGGEFKLRLDSYNSFVWYLAEFAPAELGVWTRAGELPLRWTNRSVKDTARKVSWALERKNGFRKAKIRAAHAIRGILATSIWVLKENKYLFPIVFKNNTGIIARRRIKFRVKADVDDGCMRTIALAVHGDKVIKCYYGTPTKK